MTWNPQVKLTEPNYTEEQFDSDRKTDAILCTNRTTVEQMPSTTVFWKHGKTPKMERMVGFSR